MTDITWPEQLPFPSTESYQIKPKSGVKRTEMSAGAARNRRIHRNPPDMLSMVWDMTPKEFAIFEAFFNYELLDGQSWFVMKHHTGIGMVDGEFRFVKPQEPYAVTNIGHYDFKVTATLERRKRALLSEYGYKMILIGLDDRFLIAADRLHYLVNERSREVLND